MNCQNFPKKYFYGYPSIKSFNHSWTGDNVFETGLTMNVNVPELSDVYLTKVTGTIKTICQICSNLAANAKMKTMMSS